jgi:hypothetical protein
MLSDVPKLRFFVLTCRDPRTDFRAPLVDALKAQYETWYIWLRRRPVVSGPDGTEEMSITRFLRFMARFRRDGRVPVYFNSTNTYFPSLTVLLRMIAPPGIWILDMHDDLRYHNTGLKRSREEQIIRLLRACSDVTVHAAPTLRELFPDSLHLGNASNITKLTRTAPAKNAVLVIASFDERFDFDFLLELARLRPDLSFHLHGWTRRNDEETQRQIESLPKRRSNIIYHGPYTMDDLPAILEHYQVTVAPYKTGSLLTRYIDPLRFYHCLNAGLEVISTDIPQARHMQAHIHIASDPASCSEMLTQILDGRLAKQPGFEPITWHQSVDRLVEIVQSLPRTARLGDRRAGR